MKRKLIAVGTVAAAAIALAGCAGTSTPASTATSTDGATKSTLILVIFLAGQRYFIAGIATSGMKG